MGNASHLTINANNYTVIDQALRNGIASEYDATSTYAVGDYCLYNDAIYICNTAIATAEAWTAAHWTEVTVGEELTELKSAIAQMGVEVVRLV